MQPSEIKQLTLYQLRIFMTKAEELGGTRKVGSRDDRE